MTPTRGAFALLTLLAACAPQNGTDIHPMSRDDAMASAKRVSGSTLEACTSIGYLDTDGVTTVYAQVSGYDEDGDDLAVIPNNWSDIFEDEQYYCGFDGTPIGYIAITSADEVGLDCLDTDSAVGIAGSATYADEDGDGFGAGAATMVCTLSEGDVTVNTDCDDSSETAQYVYPGAAELESTTACMADTDSDGYGDSAIVEGVAAGTDCDDDAWATNPGATETCNGVDDNCAGGIDDGLTFSMVYPDLDADGFGDDSSAGTSVCDGAGSLESLDNTDCDDGNSGINTGATDIADNGVDEDCSGSDTVTPATVYAEVCATGEQVTDYCVMYLSDMTTYPYTPDDAGWWTNIYASGVGEICTTSFPVETGHTLKIGLQCDNDSVVYWGWMVDGVHATTFTIGGADVLSVTVNTPYDDDADGVNDGSDGVVLIP